MKHSLPHAMLIKQIPCCQAPERKVIRAWLDLLLNQRRNQIPGIISLFRAYFPRGGHCKAREQIDLVERKKFFSRVALPFGANVLERVFFFNSFVAGANGFPAGNRYSTALGFRHYPECCLHTSIPPFSGNQANEVVFLGLSALSSTAPSPRNFFRHFSVPDTQRPNFWTSPGRKYAAAETKRRFFFTSAPFSFGRDNR